MSALPKWHADLPPARAYISRALAKAATPARRRSVAEWAEEDRYVAAESGSSRPGKWRNATTPYGVEMMDCLDADAPGDTVSVCAAAQLIKSELFLNWAGQTISDDPAPMMLVLPSLDELRNWNNTKWQPTRDVTPALKSRVLDVVSRDNSASTTAFKKFRGGFLVVTTASSSKGLQGRSVKRLACDEVSEFPAETGGRGDPVRQAMTRGDAHDDFKALLTSTPKELPNCRITILLDAGDRRLFYVACPECGARQHFQWENIIPPHQAGGRAAFLCQSGNGCVIDEIHKPDMLAGGVWLRTYKSEDPENPAPPDCFDAAELPRWQARGSEGRNPSFHLWQAYSPFKSWTKLWGEYEEASSSAEADALKVFYQQKLARAWDNAIDAPKSDQLFAVRGRFVKRGLVPAWACEVYGVADVQGDRIEWAAYAVGPDLSMARFDWGVIEHDPLHAQAWAELAEIIGRRFEGESTIPLGFDSFGVDSGGKKGVTERVYRFVRSRPNIYALKGAKDPDAIPLTKGKRHTYRPKDGPAITAQVYLVGGWGLKTSVYSALSVSIEAAEGERLPGGLYNPDDATLEDFQQYTAEVFRQPKSMRAGARGWWERLPGRPNEQLDLAVYARALAWWRGAYRRSPAEWIALFEARAKAPDQELPLFAARAVEQVEAPPTAPNPGNERKSLFGSRSKL